MAHSHCTGTGMMGSNILCRTVHTSTDQEWNRKRDWVLMGCTPILHYLKALWIFQAKLKPWNKVSHFNPFLVLKMFSRPRRMLHVNDPIKWTMLYEWRRRQRDTVAMSCQGPTRTNETWHQIQTIGSIAFVHWTVGILLWGWKYVVLMRTSVHATTRSRVPMKHYSPQQSRRDIHSNCRVALLNFGWPFYISQSVHNLNPTKDLSTLDPAFENAKITNHYGISQRGWGQLPRSDVGGRGGTGLP